MPRKKHIYTEQDRVAVYVALKTSEGNSAKVSRETGIPEQTVRDWKKSWDKDGGPPQELLDAAQHLSAEFVEQATSVRDILLEQYRAALQRGEIKPDKMPIHIGIFDDKIRLHKGLATSRTESVSALPNPEQIVSLLGAIAARAVEAADRRDEDIIDAEVVEQPKGLPASSQEDK